MLFAGREPYWVDAGGCCFLVAEGLEHPADVVYRLEGQADELEGHLHQ